MVYNQIPYLWPFNARDAWNLNVAKFKAHEMGMTLTSKNWQGTNAAPFQGYCGMWRNIDEMQKVEDAINKECINPKIREAIEAQFKQHSETLPRWNTPDVPAEPTPALSRPITTPPSAWNCGRTGPSTITRRPPWGFTCRGHLRPRRRLQPGPESLGNENNYDGRAWDYMTNVVIFGKDPYLVDIIGHWLGGHEPGNFGLFHIAIERHKLGMLNPMHIPVYEWVDGVAVRRPLVGFTRTPLRSFYLHQLDSEALWHLVDQPFDYSKVSEKKLSIPAKPTTRPLNQHHPNAHNPQLAIEFSVPEKGWALLEILDENGKNLEVISNSICEPGYHMAGWNTAKYASGSYKYRLRYNGHNVVHDLVLNKS